MKPDCLDDSDEGGHCAVACAVLNGGCQQSCHPTPSQPRCLCHPGFSMVEGVCKDSDECVEHPFFCEHKQRCLNTRGGYECRCADGYAETTVFLHGGRIGFMGARRNDGPENRLWCKPEVAEKPSLVVAQANRIYRMDNVGPHLLTDHHDAAYQDYFVTFGFNRTKDYVFDYEISTKRLIWAFPSGRFLVSNLSMDSDHSLKDFETPYEASALSIDWLSSNVYIGDSNAETIAVCSFKNATRLNCLDDLIRSVKIPTAIVLHPANRTIYWSRVSPEGSAIEAASMDGYDRRVLVADVARPTSLAFDEARSILYWIDDWRDGLYYVKTYHRAKSLRPTALTSLAPHSSAQLDVFEDFAFVLDDDFYKIFQVNVLNPEYRVKLHQFPWLDHEPTAVKVDHPYKQPIGSNPCVLHRCTGICVLSYAYRAGYACPGEDNHFKAWGFHSWDEEEDYEYTYEDGEVDGSRDFEDNEIDKMDKPNNRLYKGASTSNKIVLGVCLFLFITISLALILALIYVKKVRPELLRSNVVVLFKRRRFQNNVDDDDNDDEIPETATTSPTAKGMDFVKRSAALGSERVRRAYGKLWQSGYGPKRLQEERDDDDDVEDGEEVTDDVRDDVENDDNNNETPKEVAKDVLAQNEGKERIRQIWNSIETKWSDRRPIGRDEMRDPLRDSLEILEDEDDDDVVMGWKPEATLAIPEARTNKVRQPLPDRTELDPKEQQPPGMFKPFSDLERF